MSKADVGADAASEQVMQSQSVEESCGSADPLSRYDLSFFVCTSSTNQDIKEAILHGAPEGTAVVALEQSGGYGRQGRSWSSPLGGVYVSLLLRPCDHGCAIASVPTLALVISLAVRRTFILLGIAEPVLIKWPNDVVCERGKLAGISVEMIDGGVCVGMGLNVFEPAGTRHAIGKYEPVHLVDMLSDDRDHLFVQVPESGLMDSQRSYMEDVIAVLLDEVQSVYNQWLAKGFSFFRDEYRANASLQGQAVQLVSLAQDILMQGVVCDVDADGLLCLVQDDGSIVRAHSGEVHLR